MKITNTTKGDLGLSFDAVVPAGGFIEIDNDALTKFKAIPVIKGWFVSGALVESGAIEEPQGYAPKDEPKGGTNKRRTKKAD
jgi:hypothetical protein